MCADFQVCADFLVYVYFGVCVVCFGCELIAGFVLISLCVRLGWVRVCFLISVCFWVCVWCFSTSALQIVACFFSGSVLLFCVLLILWVCALERWVLLFFGVCAAECLGECAANFWVRPSSNPLRGTGRSEPSGKSKRSGEEEKKWKLSHFGDYRSSDAQEVLGPDQGP